MVTREAAIQAGTKIYTGTPCKKCGGTERYAKYGHCVACVKRHDKIFKQSARGKAASSQYYALPSVKEAKRNGHLRRTYGLSESQYKRLLMTQNGVCGICSTPPKPSSYLCVDHNHKTGKVRGLLCKACNNILGNALDDATRLRNAITYLETN